MNFPKLHLIAKNTLGNRPVLEYIVVRNGSFVAADGRVVVSIPVSLWEDYIDNSECLEGAIIHKTTIQKICESKTASVECDMDGFNLTFKDKSVQKIYFDGFINKTETAYNMIDRNTGDSKNEVLEFPDWESVLPSENTQLSYEVLGLKATYIQNIAACFKQNITGNFDLIKIELGKGHPEEVLEYPLHAMRVFPLHPDYFDKGEFAILMPVIV